MKIKLASLIILFSSISVSCQSKADIPDYSEIIYEASTRGFMLRLTLASHILTVESSNEDKSRAIQLSNENLEHLYSLINSLDLERIHDLDPPSGKSEYDAAPMAFMRIKKNGSTYESSFFDHGSPPDYLKPVVSALMELAEVD